MKEILCVVVSKKRNSKVEICIGFVYNAPQASRWYNPNFTRELDEEMKELSDQFLNTEFVIVGDMNSRIGIMKINLLNTRDCFDEIDKDNDNQFGKRVSKDFACNAEGRKLIEFCERNRFGMLNGKYGEDTKSEYMLVNQLVKVL
jgi:hypothetical protein